MLYLCYESDITACCFAIAVVAEDYKVRYNDEFLASKEECEKCKIYSRIKDFKFDWELDGSTR